MPEPETPPADDVPPIVPLVPDELLLLRERREPERRFFVADEVPVVD